MIKNMKNTALLSMALLFLSFGTACTQEKNNADVQKLNKPANTAALTVKSNATATNHVIEIKSVKKSAAGKLVDFTFMKDGKETSLTQLTKGKVVFLNFWATWCGPCRNEIPSIAEISNELKDKPFIVIGVAMERDKDAANNIATVSKFTTAKNVPYYNFIPNSEAVNAFKTSYGGIQFIPSTFIIDKDGNIIENLVGGKSKEEFMESINKVLK